ncbi:MAG: GNAT family N-acetyltransferase [Pseudomonadota bacterium]
MKLDGYDIHPLTAQSWDDFEAVLGKSGLSGCWCMYWLVRRSADWGEGQKGGSKAVNKDRFRAIAEQDPPPGLIAYAAGTPVAWARVMSRARHPGLANSRWFKTDLETEGVWSLSCFVVKTKWRRRGLTALLTRAAAEFARGYGATALEVYPTDTDETKHPATVYTGIASTFRRLGFETVQAKAPHKPMMRLTL